MIHIRPATPADVPQILAFIHELAVFENSVEKLVATEALLHDVMFGEAQPGAEAAIAELDGKAVGAAFYFFNYSSWTGWRGLYLEDLYVSPEARGHGLGRALLSYLAGVALDRGCTRFEWAVMEDNTNAQQFYRAIGAKPMDDTVVHRITGEALAKLAGRG